MRAEAPLLVKRISKFRVVHQTMLMIQILLGIWRLARRPPVPIPLTRGWSARVIYFFGELFPRRASPILLIDFC